MSKATPNKTAITNLILPVKRKRIIVVFIAFLLALTAFSQKRYTPKHGDALNEPWRWTRFNELTGKGVRCISETANHNIVFGLSRGVIVYDGIEWTEQNGNNGFTDDAVTQLVFSEDNKLYAATIKGLYEFKAQKWSKIFPFGQYSFTPDIQNINFLAKLHGGGVVASIGTGHYAALLFYQNGKYEILASKETLNTIDSIDTANMHVAPKNRCLNNTFCIENIFQDSQKRFWVWESKGGKDGKIFYFKRKNGAFSFSREFTAKDGLIKGQDALFEEDNSGNIWVINRTFHKGLSIYNGHSWISTTLDGENSHLSIKRIGNTMWIGGFGVLYAFRNGKWKTYKKPQTPIPTSKIFTYNDSRGYLWVAGIKGEVVRIDENSGRWNSFKSLNFHCEDNNGNLWFIDAAGNVVVKKESKWYAYDTDDGLPDAPVKVFCTKAGLICAAGSFKSQACIAFFDGKKWKRQLFPELSWGIDYRAVFEDTDNNLWIGCCVNYFEEKGHKGGVIKITNPGKSNQKTRHFLPEKSLGITASYGIAQTADGAIWFAGSYLVKFKDNKWTQYKKQHPLNQYINTMGNTPDGALWIGSRRFGVFKLKDDEWTAYSADNGMKDNNIVSILPIDENNIWIATNNGFGRFDGTCWTSELFHNNLTLSQEEGELKNQAYGTIWINRVSRAWTRRAICDSHIDKEDVAYYSTLSYRGNKFAPDTKITVYSEKVPSSGNTFIEWEGVDAWSETPSSKLRYSYRLNNGEWSNFSKKTNITLLNIKNGDYVFEVRARDIDFNIDPSPARVSFEVLPPVWKQAWLLSLILIFLLTIFIFLYTTWTNKKKLEKLNSKLTRRGEEIERQNAVLQQQKEQILQQTINEQERNQSKIRFFTNISHEFRTPLTLITGIIDNLNEKKITKKAGYLTEQLTVVKKNASQLLHLINQLMDFRKLENKSMELSVSECDVVAFVCEVCNTFRAFAKKYHIKLKCIPDFEQLNAWLDVDKFEKVLFNLISNAIKNTPEHGRVFIKIKKAEVDDLTYLKVVVEDTGCGIPNNKLDEIFEPFHQIDSPKQKRYEGTGIGLSIVYNYIRLHHGKISVISSTNPGIKAQRGYSTQFIIHLPLEKKSYRPSEIRDTTKEPGHIDSRVYIDKNTDETLNTSYRKKLPQKRTVAHVLIVEDNTDLRHFMADILSIHFKVIEAQNGAEGFDLAVSAMPDIIVSDVMMPEMSGSEMCKKIKTDLRTSHIPVILLTALTTDENKIDGFQTGADDYITKPFNVNVLLARINNILENRTELKRKFKNTEITHPDEEQVTSTDNVFLKKLKSVLEENYNNSQFNVEELSREIGLSSRHLLHKIKTLVGMSPVEYIRVFRLQKAAQLLLGKKGSISEIAYETGFSDPGYFGKCFARHYGMSASDYVKAYR